MYKHIFLAAAALFFLQFLRAQTNDSTGIIIHKNSRLDEMMKKQFIGTTATSKKATGLKATNYKVKRSGYRLLVLNTNDRELTYKTKGLLLGRYPSQQLYTVYQSPFFKLKMGDFVSRKEAEKFQVELSKVLVRNVFIIRETVLVNAEDEAKL